MKPAHKTSVSVLTATLPKITTRMEDLRIRHFSTYVTAIIQHDLLFKPAHIRTGQGSPQFNNLGSTRKSLSILGVSLDDIEERYKALGYPVLSHYIQGLILQDLTLQPDLVSDSHPQSIAAEKPHRYRVRPEDSSRV
jgi:hypothetical protein